MSCWIKCSDRMPLSANGLIMAIEVIVTDGFRVGMCGCYSGDKPNPWVEFSKYGDIYPHEITHWQPLPQPPED